MCIRDSCVPLREADIQVHRPMAAVQLRQHPAEAGARRTASGQSQIPGPGSQVPKRPLPLMFILDSLMISGIRWALETALTAAEAEMNDDSVLREQLLETEMRREMGEISDAEFSEIETDLLARIREIRARREGGSGPID